MDVKLIVVEGKNAGQKVPVQGPKFFIGRSEECQLRPSSSQISRHHAVILVEEGYVAVRDFASKNGTFVNEEPVGTERELKNGDQLRMGPLKFQVELGVEVGGKKKPKVRSIEEAAARTAETGNASADDLDIFGLLGEDDDTVTDAPALAETQTVDASPTAIDTPPEEKPSEKPSEQPPGKPRERKKKGGLVSHLGQTPKQQAASSRAAADEVIKQLISRRR